VVTGAHHAGSIPLAPPAGAPAPGGDRVAGRGAPGARWQGLYTKPGQVALALAVDDVAAAQEELRALGVPVVCERQESRVCYQAAVRAPDGNVLILHHRKDGSAG
jgi:catechol 2,3-dioxygenase-like lactoylglutathione lyase family enzyme